MEILPSFFSDFNQTTSFLSQEFSIYNRCGISLSHGPENFNKFQVFFPIDSVGSITEWCCVKKSFSDI